ncbi:apolipoprotein N-acyltransferase [Desulfobulbus elongatus]|uniref:apolipoprotein N-acyltransferase n=1 Tax=Desulfobulbus elongatus TaxID=53332 RepID=UPI000685F2CF|nr:apolipoprotein N-acyltransferase [Desulfobulbus elongatus]
MIPSRKANGAAVLILATLGSAGLLAAAMPGRVGWWPLLFVGLAPLLLFIYHARPGRSLVAGFLFGLVYHLALLYWILIVLGRYGGLPLGLALPALVLLASYMACFPAVCCCVLSLIAGRHRQRSMAALVWTAPVAWVGFEFLRSVLFTGFPWMDLGYGLFGQPVLIQAADLGGHHLLTFALVLCNGLAAAGLDRCRRDSAQRDLQARWPLLAAVAILLGIGGYSAVRQQTLAAALPRAHQARVAVVQGNIDQAIKWSSATRAATVDAYLRLSQRTVQEEGAELVVWPETALPFYPQRDPLINRVVDFATANTTWLLTGAPLYTVDSREDGTERVRYWNGALLLGPGGRVDGTYAKQHLVPFGEYVPLRRLLPFLQPLVVNIDDFSAGTEKEPLVLGAMRLGMLICYESIFPDIARESVDRGANLLVNITNDAWYGRSSAPHQSMAMAVLRAVENRRALVRAANTGISGFVDPLGRISNQTGIFVEAAEVASVPLLEQGTVFGRGGHRFGMACAVLIVLLLATSRFRRR